MDIVWIVLGALCLLVGLAGCFLPALPGPPLAYVGMLLLHITERVQFTVSQLVVWAILVVVVQVLDYFTPLIGTKYGGGSKWGNRGCIAGTVIGMFFFPPWGIILGPLVGAIVGELLGGKLTHEALAHEPGLERAKAYASYARYSVKLPHHRDERCIRTAEYVVTHAPGDIFPA